MSHFTVLVPARDEDHLADLLQPYHEYECTGVEDEYVAWVDDIHDDYLEKFNNDTVGVVVKDGKPVGTKYSDKSEIRAMWQRAGHGHSSKDRFVVADGYELVDMPFTEYFPDFETYMREWSGYTNRHPDTGRFGRWTNPDAKWDWWSVGGRWTGLLKLRSPSELAGSGRPGIMTKPNNDDMRADYAPVSDVDWEGMLQETIDKNLEVYDAIHEVLNQFEGRDLQDFEGKYQDFRGGPEKWISNYASETEPRRSRQREVFPTFLSWVKWTAMEAELWKTHTLLFKWDEIKTHLLPRNEFIASFQADAQTYAFIDLDGKWNQRGEMGWWGMDNPDKGTPDYDKAWWEFVKSLPEDQIIYIVDCHI